MNGESQIPERSQQHLEPGESGKGNQKGGVNNQQYPLEDRDIGKRGLYTLSHWGCVGYIILLTVAAGAAIINLVVTSQDPDQGLAAPLGIRATAIALMLGIAGALAWTRTTRRY